MFLLEGIKILDRVALAAFMLVGEECIGPNGTDPVTVRCVVHMRHQ